jgi:dihydroflavonol-4-reductase
MDVAVTGASGHVGSALIRELINRGHRVKVLIHHDTKGVDGVKVESVRGDMLDVKSLSELCRDAEVVFHLAARISIGGNSKADLFDTNVEGTRNIIHCCADMGVKRLVHFSSIHAFRNSPVDEPLDESWPAIGSSRFIYDWSKAEGEKLVIDATSQGLDAVVINPTAIIGPFDYKPSYLGMALIKIYLNKLPMLVPGGYNWVDVRDVANGAITAAMHGRKGEKYLLSGQYLTLKELSGIIQKVTGNKTPKFICPTPVAKLGVPFINVIAKLRKEHPLYTSESLDILLECNKHIQNAKARRELDYNPRPIEATISDTIEWYKSNGYV